jgi:hypothetical protein
MMPSLPANTPIFPPEPSSMYTEPATLVVFMVTVSKFWAVTLKEDVKSRTTIVKFLMIVFLEMILKLRFFSNLYPVK